MADRKDIYTVTARPVAVKNCRKVYVALARFATMTEARAYALAHGGDVRLTCESKLYEEA